MVLVLSSIRFSLENKNASLYPIFLYVREQYPYDAWFLTMQVSRNPLLNLMLFEKTPEISLDYMINNNKIYINEANENKQYSYIRLDENSQYYVLLNYVIKTENTIQVLKFMTASLNILLIFSVLC